MRLWSLAASRASKAPSLIFVMKVMAQIFDRGDPAPKRSLTFDIEVTDQGTTTGPAFPRTAHRSRLAEDRNADVRQRGHLTQRRLRYSFQPSHLAHRSLTIRKTATRQGGRKVR
jgi:hypothetical protein